MPTSLWVIGGAQGPTPGKNIATSVDDGVTFSANTDAFGDRGVVNQIVDGNGTFVATGTNNLSGFAGLRRLIQKSTDGVSWSIINTATSFEAFFSQSRAVGYGNNLWVIACRVGTGYVISSDLTNWTFHRLPWTGFSVQTNRILWTGSQWLAFADVSNSTGTSQSLATSTDAITWNLVPTPFDGAFGASIGALSVVQNGSQFIVGGLDRGAGTALIIDTTDLVHWTQHATPWDTGGGGAIEALAIHNGILVAGGQSPDLNHLIMTASLNNLNSWTVQSTPWDNNAAQSPELINIASDGVRIIATGVNNSSTSITKALLVSLNTSTWSSPSSPFDGSFGFTSGLSMIPPPPLPPIPPTRWGTDHMPIGLMAAQGLG